MGAVPLIRFASLGTFPPVGGRLWPRSVFPALREKEMENQSFREFISRKDTPTRATGRETGGIEPSRAGTQARI